MSCSAVVYRAMAGAATGGAQATAGPSPGGEAPAAEALQVSEENAAVLPLLNVAGAPNIARKASDEDEARG